MIPYYDEDGCTIFLGDCRDILPSLAPVDLVLTDPPYGLGIAQEKNRTGGIRISARNYGNAAWDDEPIEKTMIDLMRLKSRYQIIFGGNFFEVPPSSCWLVWDKDNSGGHDIRGDFADCELAWTNLPKAVRRVRYRWNGFLQEHMGHKKEVRVHPTQKPIEVMTWCLSQVPPECQTILDPFMGSGTTLVAAKRMGRKAIGIELDEQYCAIAVQRLAQLELGLTPRLVSAGGAP